MDTMKVRILNSNTHVGQNLRNGLLVKSARELDADIVTVQEVSRVAARARLRKQFSPRVWGIHGFVPPSIGPSSAGNHVLWRKAEWEKVGGRRDLISRQMFQDGKRDKWHPSRREGQVRLVSRDGNAHRLAVSSDHTWTTAGHDWNTMDRVVQGHKKQCRVHSENAWEAQQSGFHAVNAGDYNAAVAPGDGHVAFIELMMRTHGMFPARSANAKTAHLDAAFVSKGVVVVSFDWIPEHIIGSDHPGFLLVVDI